MKRSMNARSAAFATFSATLMVAVFTTTVAAQQATPTSPARVTAIKAGRLLDVRTGAITQNAVIVVTNNRITAAGADVKVPAGATVVDLSKYTVLPGLIDAHTHLLQNYDPKLGGDDENMLATVATIGTVKRALLGAAMAREDLESGITTVRDVGNSGLNGDVALRDAINAGWVIGPRIVASTRALSAAGGQFGHLVPEAQKLIENEYVVVTNVDEARHAVQQAVYDGADVIKVIVNTGPRVVSLEVLKAIVEEASRVGRKVAAHAIGNDATRIAAEAGVASIEHAYTVPDDVLAMMVAKKIFLVPTDYPAFVYDNLGGSATDTPSPGATNFANSNAARLKRAVAAGVRIAFGSDEYYQLPGRTRGESSHLTLHAYEAAGMTPLQVIQAATINSAELLGLRGIGSIEAGKLADIVAVEGNPLDGIAALDSVRFVMKDGVIVRR